MNARRVTRIGAQLALYVGAPLLGSLAPLVVIPAVTSQYGAAGWASVAVALSVGLAGAVIGELGWVVVGPQKVSRDRAAASGLYERALASRLVAVGVLALPVAVASGTLAHEHRTAAVLLGLGILGGALSPSWYWTGLGRPATILLVEALPRMTLALSAAGAIALGAPLESYGAALCAAAALTVLLSARTAGVRAWPSRAAFRAAPSTARSQSVVMLGRTISTLYRALPAALLAGVAPGAVATFSAVDRPLRMGLQFLAVVPQRLQTWVGVEDQVIARRRAVQVVLMNIGLGAAAGVLVLAAMPTFVAVLFTGVVAVDGALAAIAGLLVAVVCAARGFGLALVALGRADASTWAAASSAVVGIPGAVLGGVLAGAEGTMAALVIAEFVGLVLQWGILARAVRAPSGAGSGTAQSARGCTDAERLRS
ncbi:MULTISPECIES: hypothetical protein [unclassified Curtobacterium]|uniref:hypothetical protein n=1 Tax=unclassified Curtobacterium TaxID=257496 RepID=UPI000F4AF94F|nr:MULTISPECIES: hypothetical protein [unclassified Curtobacterium]ROP65158.1 O-antigen/teichoic acid export membrane protein [Curtobacterium sp. ZW137]TCK65424.1 O-antigen/teichoic acid export membrane protein [Curtobacterium sp. PhB136]